MIREPMGRIFSHYKMDVRSGLTSKGLLDLLEDELSVFGSNYIESSQYFKAYNRLIDVFGPNNVLVIDFDDYIHKNELVIRNALSFLNINYKYLKAIHTNEARYPKKWIQGLYKHYYLRKIYNVFIPNFFRMKMQSIIFNKRSELMLEPEVERFVIEKLYNEYKQMLKLKNNKLN
jgi:hypothetical protein